MWFHLGFQNFIGKKIINADSCDIFISDFSRIWHKSLSNNEILSISKALNPLFEVSPQKLKDVTLNLFEDTGAKKDIRENDDKNIFLKLCSNIMGVKFQFEVVLKQGDGETLYKEFTVPMLLLLVKIQNREKKLIKIIQDKDAEIESYKQEYGDKSNYLSTKPFNEKEFYSEEFQMNNSWDPRSFLDCISDKILSIETVSNDIKEEEPPEEKSEKKSLANKCDKTKLVFKDSNGSKPCLFFDNQTIKKRRKQNDGFKIKF